MTTSTIPPRGPLDKSIPVSQVEMRGGTYLARSVRRMRCERSYDGCGQRDTRSYHANAAYVTTRDAALEW